MLPYDEAGVNSRFLEEVARLIQEGKVANQVEYVLYLGKFRSLISQIRTGRYKVNLEILWLSYNMYQMDVWYVMFNQRTSSEGAGLLDMGFLDQRGKS